MILRERPCDLSHEQFLELYGSIYEHSRWVAEGAWAKRGDKNLNSVDGLHSVMADVVNAASEEQQERLICAHPDLAGKAAVRGELTAESKAEQSGAGLDACTPAEFNEFQSLNKAYKNKFGFPFIIAVKGHNRHSILAAFGARLNHNREREFKTAINEIHKIARLRLEALAG
ncbi:2-oxo-4-hydroxy-4-carboxy-5-ureidoimidazoline decarboxylase [Kordiimonas sp.]|uniref:2-oxo-4-hydroxy-4-carboxy-5-ureidoimidazoline decarboxylase n=1 Tax=Kordiimonas sp. TaxID=1970157 RepID=UPI003A908C8D